MPNRLYAELLSRFLFLVAATICLQSNLVPHAGFGSARRRRVQLLQRSDTIGGTSRPCQSMALLLMAIIVKVLPLEIRGNAMQTLFVQQVESIDLSVSITL